MSGPLILVAAGGLCREVLATLEADGSDRQVVGILDDDPARQGSIVGGHRVIGSTQDIAAHPDPRVVVCAGSGRARRHLVTRLVQLGVGSERFASVIDPTVRVPSSCTIGRGSILLAQVALTSDVTIGSHVVVMPNVTLTHDNRVADYATLCAGVTLGGSVQVAEAAYLGMGSSVREGRSVGADSVLGMGAVLLTDLPAGETWAGVPARVLMPVVR